MNRRALAVCAMVLMSFVATPVLAQPDEATDTPSAQASSSAAAPAPLATTAPSNPAASATTDDDPPVAQYLLDGPRIGMTFMSNGEPRTQFGWHLENQAAPGSRGPWFLVERVLLVGGVERGEFIPSGSLIFGIRTPDSFEFGVGPSLTISALGASTAVVIAAGKTVRYGGIRVPINAALALSDHHGTTSARFTLISGWAIKQSEAERARARRPYRYGLER